MNENYELAAGKLQYTKGIGAAVAPQKFNPEFVSQFDINITKHYYYSGTPTTELPAASLPENLKVDTFFALFGISDFKSGYVNAGNLAPVSNWDYLGAKIIDQTAVGFFAPSFTGVFNLYNTVVPYSIAFGNAKKGDVIFMYSWYDAIAGEVYLCEIVIDCKSVSYGTLIESTFSDTFKINNIRYKVPTGEESQFEKQLKITRQSLFGKLSTDEVSPASYQQVQNFQQSILDIPIIKGVDKETSFASYMDYLNTEILLSFFVEKQKKIIA